MIQAYFDESETPGKVLILGGLLAKAEQWEAFSAEWQRLLDGDRWATFKMKSVNYRGGKKGRERTKHYYYAITKHVKAAVAMAVPIAVLERSLARHQVVAQAMPGLKNPYVWGIKGIIEAVPQNQYRWGFSESIDFIFDSHTKEKEVRAGWRMYEVFPPNVDRSLIGRTPKFEDDDRFLPLQAADMWVWFCRRQWLEDGRFPPSSPFPWGALSDMHYLQFEWSEQQIDRELSIMSAGLEAAGLT